MCQFLTAVFIEQGPESWVVVHKLKSQSDGGILDPDDVSIMKLLFFILNNFYMKP